ncbi:MAG: hypothetical protein AAGI17_07645 [Planctomycetota bacterium]
MKRFVFRLQPVLEQRKRSEQDQQRVVAELERQRVALEDRIRGWQRSISQEKADLAARLDSGTADVRGARVQAGASLMLVAKAQEAVLLLAGVHERIDNARLELLRRATARRAIELLKERQQADWDRAFRKREEAALDEIVSGQFARQASGTLEETSP